MELPDGMLFITVTSYSKSNLKCNKNPLGALVNSITSNYLPEIKIIRSKCNASHIKWCYDSVQEVGLGSADENAITDRHTVLYVPKHRV